MSDMSIIIIYLGIFFLGLIAGNTLSYKKYGKLILDVLDNLRYTEKINVEQYDYYKEKFIKQKDSLKSIKDFINRKKEKKEE